MMFNSIGRKSRTYRAPQGRRAYAVGDIHGRADLLDRLLAEVERDLDVRPEAETYLVFLGDLIDRGPASRDVVERLRCLSSERFRPIFLLGNHEEVLLRLMDGERGLLASWLKFGGAECAQSYGLDPRQLLLLPEEQAIEAVRGALPSSHIEFLRGFIDTFRFGDYLFVHAGIRPGIELADQSQRDLRWIRAAFLNSQADHGFIVIHGHTIDAMVVERANRIGIDTGAYATGVLTAIGLEGDERWYLSTAGTHSEQSSTLVD
ncbi:MAG TPA: metallophosphoesterase family protein [Sphingomicrobium sp.]|nr:metallophosphoesterase family protein [Sphingomicrobium sp.]